MRTGFQKLIKLSLIFFYPIFFFTSTVTQAQDGAKLFRQNCATCHSLDGKPGTGPTLQGVFSRVPSEDWMFKWIKNNQKLVASGDAHAIKTAGQTPNVMTPFEFLSDEDVKAIMAYVKAPPVEVATTRTEPQPGDGEAKEEGAGLNTYIVLISLLVLFIILIAVFSNIRRSLRNALNAKKGLPEEPEMNFWEESKVWMGRNKRLVAVGALILLFFGSVDVWNALMGIGVYEGYKPAQPIKFSHKVHAGDNAINCIYCHNTAEKSKVAGIPTVNVCMNCHKGIDKGPSTGTVEIARIYDAAGWNPETQKYDKPERPIKWVKVHNLPDFVFFSHQQHVVVGKQECVTCHGDMTETDVAMQHSPLTMGWCIDCHRTTEVAMEGNPYYEELHRKLAEKYKNKKITVSQIGGLECGKCHY